MEAVKIVVTSNYRKQKKGTYCAKLYSILKYFDGSASGTDCKHYLAALCLNIG